MEYRFSSETKTIYLDVPYKLMITSDTGPALGNDGKGKLHAVVRNTKTGADVSFDSSCFTWTRREDSSNFTPVNSDTLDLTLDDLVYGGYANFVVSFEKSGLYWKDTTFFTMSKTTKGEDGAAGYSQATVTLYKRSSEEQTKYDGEVLTYVFSTGGVTGSTGTWSRTVPSGDEKLWVISASAFANSTEDEIEVDDWTSPAVLSENGTVGQDGYTVLTVILYQRSKTKPAKPTGASTYYFDTNTISGVEPWTITVPDGTEPVWVTSATAATRLEVHDDISADEWSEPQMLVKNGDDGISSYTYIRYSDDNGATFTENSGTVVGEYMGVCVTTASTAPSDVSSYTWSKTKGETGDKGDSITISEKSIQYASSASGTVAPTAWSDTPSPVKGQYLWTRTYVKYSDNTENTSYSVAYVATDGKNSLGVYRAMTALSTSSTSVNASNIATKPSRDWMVGDTIIDTNGLGFAVTIATSLSSSTISIGYRFNIKGEQGEKGDKGDKGDEGDPAPYTRQIYCASEKKPDTPTETCDQVPSGWSLQIPTRTETQVHWISMGVVSVTDGVYEYSTWSEPAKYTADESGIVPIVQWKWGSSDTINPDEEDNTISLGDGTLLEVNGQAVTIAQNSGTGWSNTIPAYSDDKPYLWKREWRYASEGVDAGWVYYCVTGKQGVEGSYNSLGYKIDGSSITFAGLDRDGIPSLGSFRANLGGEVVAFQRTVFTITSDLDGNYHDRYFLVAHWTSTVGTLSLCYLVPVSEIDDDGNTTYRMKWVAQDGTEITTTSVDGTAYDPYVLADIRMVSGASIKSVTLVNPAKLKAYESDYFMTLLGSNDRNMDDINTVAKALGVERVFEKVAALEAFIDNLFANYIKIYGALYGGGYSKYGDNINGSTGFHISADGMIQANNAILKSATIEGNIECNDDGVPIFYSTTEVGSQSVTIPSKTRWAFSNLLSSFTDSTQPQYATVDGTQRAISLVSKISTWKQFSVGFGTTDQSWAYSHTAMTNDTYTVNIKMIVSNTNCSVVISSSKKGELYTRKNNCTETFSISLEKSEELNFTYTVGGGSIAGSTLYIDIIPTRRYLLLQGFYAFYTDTEYYISNHIVYNTFDSDNFKNYASVSVIANAVAVSKKYYIENCSVTYNSNPVSITSIIRIDRTLVLYLSSGETLLLSWDTGDSTISEYGYYNISGSFDIQKKNTGIYAYNLLPAKEGNSYIGASDNRYQGFFSTLDAETIIASTKIVGQVNSENTSNKVWGAVAN